MRVGLQHVQKKKFLTCVFPPEFSWTRLREREAEQQKDENKAPITLHSPLATSSWKKGTQKYYGVERERVRERESQRFTFFLLYMGFNTYIPYNAYILFQIFNIVFERFTWFALTSSLSFSANILAMAQDVAKATKLTAMASPTTSPMKPRWESVGGGTLQNERKHNDVFLKSLNEKTKKYAID